MNTVIDLALARWDQFIGRFQPIARAQSYRKVAFTNAQPTKQRAIPLFGADSGFGEDWVTYRSPPPQGPATQPQVLQDELRESDGDVDKEWKGPNLAIPSMVAHGKRLDYSTNTDQRPVAHDFTPADKPITLNAVEPRKDFQSLPRNNKQLTPGDQASLDLQKYPFDFSV